MRKLYCYVDETGQDKRSDFFIVTVVVTGEERQRLIEACEAIELETQKGPVKWIKSRYSKRLAYVKAIMREPILRGKLNFCIYHDLSESDYLELTIKTISAAFEDYSNYKATVLIDGLQKNQQGIVGPALRRRGINIRKVRGVKKEENNTLVRLADNFCGFVRMAIESEGEIRTLFEKAKQKGHIVEIRA